jgi:Site-specific recombinases, DNA invertase Pin homologs
MTTGALYIRVSTEDQTEFSPDAQKRVLLDYAKKNDILIDSEYIFIDEGISGRTATKRPAFMKMIATAKSKPKPFDVILVHKFDRFARSREDSIVYKSLLKRECNIKVTSISESIDDDKFSILLEAMLEAMAEYYSLNLSDEVKKGMTEKALRGGYQSDPPLGYKMEKGSIPYVVPEQAEIVKLVFEKYTSDYFDKTTIARYLNEHGFRTKRNNLFETRSINYILSNPFYIGNVRWNKLNTASQQLNPKEDVIYAKGQHEAIITENVFKLAHERLERENRPYKKRSIASCKHWLSGIVKCATCDKSMGFNSRTNVSSKKGNKAYFQCYGYAKGIHKGSNMISENSLIENLKTSLSNIIYTGDINYKVIQKVEKNSFEITNIEKELSKINLKETRIKLAYMDGIDTLDEYKANKKLLGDLRSEFQTKLEQLNVNIDIKDTKSDMLDRISNVYDIITSEDFDYLQKGEALRSVLEKIVYSKTDGYLEFYYYYS